MIHETVMWRCNFNIKTAVIFSSSLTSSTSITDNFQTPPESLPQELNIKEYESVTMHHKALLVK